MPDSTLGMQWQELQARIGSFLGWNRGALYGDVAWTNKQQFELDGITQSGLRQFYFACQESGAPIDWSFLRPTGTFTLGSGQSIIVMPDDFGGTEGQCTLLTSGTTAQPWKIEWRNEGELRSRYSIYPTMTGPPQYVSQVPIKGGEPTKGQRFELLFFPLADQAYQIQVPYYVNPDIISATFPYPYGGAQHAETILESCLAIAEQRLDDQSTVHAQKYAERLMASLAIDRRNKPAKLGRNLDRSDWSEERWNPHWYQPPATYNGNTFG